MNGNDVFSLPMPVEATAIGERSTVVLPAGHVVSVVLVIGDADAPAAHEVEAFLEGSNQYALATVEAKDIQDV